MKKIKSLKSLTAVFRYINNHPLARRHRLAAYSKFICWQLTQLIHRGEKTVAFVGTTRLSVNKGMTGATGNIYLGVHDFYEMGFLLHFLRHDDLFADVGANIGSYSILASGVVGAKTIAFEPAVETFLQLQKNVSINQLQSRIKTYNIAVGAKEDKLYFTTSLDTVNHVVASYEAAKNQVEVNVDTLDNIVKDERAPALIKIDVEGFETEVIKGMEKTLAHEDVKAIIIELNGSGLRYGYDENEIHHTLIAHHFEPFLYDPFTRNFTPANGYGAFNTLYLRDLPFIQERVRQAGKIKLFNESF